jgi:hypothetical protein
MASNGATVTLLADVSLGSASSDSLIIGGGRKIELTINGGGHKISGSNEAGSLLAVGNGNVKVTNLTVENAGNSAILIGSSENSLLDIRFENCTLTGKTDAVVNGTIKAGSITYDGCKLNGVSKTSTVTFPEAAVTEPVETTAEVSPVTDTPDTSDSSGAATTEAGTGAAPEDATDDTTKPGNSCGGCGSAFAFGAWMSALAVMSAAAAVLKKRK